MATAYRSKKRIDLEKILLASIPVIGAIIIAVIPGIKSCTSKERLRDKDDTVVVSQMRIKAGLVNDMIVYKRYDDLASLMVDGLKPIVTREKFLIVSDSIQANLGEFLRPIDTSYSSANGNHNFFIKNQYKQGISINYIILDNSGKIFGLQSMKYPN